MKEQTAQSVSFNLSFPNLEFRRIGRKVEVAAKTMQHINPGPHIERGRYRQEVTTAAEVLDESSVVKLRTWLEGIV